MKNLTPRNQSGRWTACEPGTIKEVAGLGTSSPFRRREFLQRMAGFGVASIIVAGAAHRFGWMRGFRNSTPGTIGCIQVHQHLADHIANRLTDATLGAQISNHLRHCSSCRDAARRLFKELGCPNREGRTAVPEAADAAKSVQR